MYATQCGINWANRDTSMVQYSTPIATNSTLQSAIKEGHLEGPSISSKTNDISPNEPTKPISRDSTFDSCSTMDRRHQKVQCDESSHDVSLPIPRTPTLSKTRVQNSQEKLSTPCATKSWVPVKMLETQGYYEGNTWIWIPKRTKVTNKRATKTTKLPTSGPKLRQQGNKTKVTPRFIPKNLLQAQGYYKGNTRIWVPKLNPIPITSPSTNMGAQSKADKSKRAVAELPSTIPKLVWITKSIQKASCPLGRGASKPNFGFDQTSTNASKTSRPTPLSSHQDETKLNDRGHNNCHQDLSSITPTLQELECTIRAYESILPPLNLDNRPASMEEENISQQSSLDTTLKGWLQKAYVSFREVRGL